ncbi:calcium channel flower homolog [Pecten maximus]|uniref:calcium channel flower homolog n=1 Tax=Pecten maximus TaxID=6579 RepID=UPI001458C30C|nr:calcium channel flower homolog [Pecten maximus]
MQPNTQQPPPPPPNNDQATWWFRILVKSIGTIGGLIAMITGIVTCISLSATCIVSGVLQMLVGFIVVLFEAPCCCQFIEFADKVGKFSDNRAPWQKAVIYCGLSLIPVLMCFGMSTVFGSALVFVCGVLYGMVFLGKKADRDSMKAKARGDDVEMQATLMDNEDRVDLHVPDNQPK